MLTAIFAVIVLLVLSPPTGLGASQHILWHIVTPGTVNSVAISRNGSLMAVGVQVNETAGVVYLIDKGGSVVWSHSIDIAISSVAISENASFVAAGGWQLKGGCPRNLNITGYHSCPADFYANGGVYLLSRNGDILWKHDTGNDPVFGVLINGSRVVATPVGSSTLIIDKSGELLSTSQYAETGVESPDGRYRFVGTGGTLSLLQADGTLLWNRYMDSPALSTGISADDSTISIVTNWGVASYDINGKQLWNYTSYFSPSSIAVSGNGSRTFAGVWTDWQPSLLVFTSNGNLLQSFQLGIVHQIAISADDYLVVGSGPRDTGSFSRTSGSVYLLGPPGIMAPTELSLLFAVLVIAPMVAIALVVFWKFKLLRFRRPASTSR